MTTTAWCVVYREAPSPREIAKVLVEDNDTAWLMENAMRARPRDADERHAIKEIAAWYKQEWRQVDTVVRMASGRLGYHRRGVITHLVKDAADKAGERGHKPLEQLEHGSAKRRDVARKLGIDDPAESTAGRESASFTDGAGQRARDRGGAARS